MFLYYGAASSSPLEAGHFKTIKINEPMLGREEIQAAVRVLKTRKLSDGSYEGGERVREFERNLRELLGVKHAVAVNSGTAALFTALSALKVGPGGEVIVPSFTFLSTANVVLALGAKPIFVDVKDDYNMDAGEVRRAITKRTRAIIPVHLYGYPADLDEIHELARKNSVSVVEDAAESLGSTYKGKQTGSTSEFGCFSLYATKVITSGEGGAISTNDDELADKVRMIRNHGMVHGYDSRVLGYNYRMPEVLAAVASAQMKKLVRFIRIRRRNARDLIESVREADVAKFTQESADRTHCMYLCTFEVEGGRDAILERLKSRGIGAAVYFRVPVHQTPLYKELGYSGVSLPRTEDAAKHVISLPVHPGVTERDVERIATEFTSAVRLSR